MTNFTLGIPTNVTNSFSQDQKFGECKNSFIGELRLSGIPTVTKSWILALSVNGITCPFIILLNILVIMAVKRKPSLQSRSNILLACLAAMDALTGLLMQPLFVAWLAQRILRPEIAGCFLSQLTSATIPVATFSSLLHLALITFDRLIAIKCTMHYENIVTTRSITASVVSIWTFVILTNSLRIAIPSLQKYLGLFFSLTAFSCFFFMACSYAVMFRETQRHQKRIRTQQLPHQEVRRFLKDYRTLKTTVFFLGSFVLCYMPFALACSTGLDVDVKEIFPWTRTLIPLNSLLTPLIYCWRKEEFRKSIFSFSPAVTPM